MLEWILPVTAVAVEAFDDVEPVQLFPAEKDLVRRAVDERRREFATARRCARQALATLRIAPAPLLPAEGGAPAWPGGIVGSLTHCAGYRAAVVARTTALASVGVDAEPNEPLRQDVLEMIALRTEQTMVAELLNREPRIRWDRLLFSAKESVYKTWFPLARRWLDFPDAVVSLYPDNTFNVRLLVDGPILRDGRVVKAFSGRWLVRHGLALTAIAVPAG